MKTIQSMENNFQFLTANSFGTFLKLSVVEVLMLTLTIFGDLK